MSEEKIEVQNSASATSDHRDVNLRLAKTVHRNIAVDIADCPTYVIAVAISIDQNKNFINRVTCKKGIPIQGYVYDSQTDSYLIECADFFHLGFIPYSFVMKQNGVLGWELNVPMPETVIKKCLSVKQKKELTNFKKHFNSSEYIISFIQMVYPN